MHTPKTADTRILTVSKTRDTNSKSEKHPVQIINDYELNDGT